MGSANRTLRAAELIENRSFDEIAIGDAASLGRMLKKADAEFFALMSEDINPAGIAGS